jgi:hypothetical protein
MNLKQIKSKLKKFKAKQFQVAFCMGVKPCTLSLFLKGVHKSERLKEKLVCLISILEQAEAIHNPKCE